MHMQDLWKDIHPKPSRRGTGGGHGPVLRLSSKPAHTGVQWDEEAHEGTEGPDKEDVRQDRKELKEAKK